MFWGVFKKIAKKISLFWGMGAAPGWVGGGGGVMGTLLSHFPLPHLLFSPLLFGLSPFLY